MGVFYSTSLRRLPEGMVTQFQRWLFENTTLPSLIQLGDFLNREADFLPVAREAPAGVSRERRLPSELPSVSRDFPSSPPEADGSSSSQCLAVIVAEVESQLKRLPVEERSSFVFEKRLCFNCLKAGHSAQRCWSRQRYCTCNGDTTRYCTSTAALHRSVIRPTRQLLPWQKTATTIMHGIKILFLSWDIEKSSLIPLRCSDARSRGKPRHRANLVILRDKSSVLILCIIVVAVFFFWSR